MTEIRAFPAVVYNQEKVKIEKVICPPYDVISKKQQDQLHKRDPRNFIRVLLGKDKSGDDGRDNKYARAKQTFSDWLKEGVLTQDDQSAIYFYRQEYKVMGERHTRLGFISLMKIQDDEEAKIYPHEKTHSEAKEDRLKLWSKLNANLSSIFVCFSDRERKVEKIFAKDISKTEPFIDAVDDNEVRHLLWRLTDEEKIAQITTSISHQPLFIADGHHRYEVAKMLRRAKMEKESKPTGNESFNFVMTYFTNMDSRDLKIFPLHRVVKKLGDSSAGLDFLDEYFRTDKIKTKEDLVILLAKAGQNEHAFGLYTRDGIRLLRLKNKMFIDKEVKEGSSAFRHLDATILKHFVFDRLGVATEDIIYNSDSAESMTMVDEGEAQAVFIMNPVRIHQLRDIALNGERMPPKTTYFYPKAISGLTVYKMD